MISLILTIYTQQKTSGKSKKLTTDKHKKVCNKIIIRHLYTYVYKQEDFVIHVGPAPPTTPMPSSSTSLTTSATMTTSTKSTAKSSSTFTHDVRVLMCINYGLVIMLGPLHYNNNNQNIIKWQ